MRHLDFNWIEFLEAMRLWEGLSTGARRLFLERLRAAPRDLAGEGEAEALLEKGLAERHRRRGGLVVGSNYRRFAQAARAMHRLPLFHSPQPLSMAAYLAENFTEQECCEFPKAGSFPSVARAELARLASSEEWVRGFLRLRSPTEWNEQYRRADEWLFRRSTQGFEAAQRLLRYVVDRTGPLTFATVMEDFADLPPVLLANAIHAAIETLLLFPALRPDDLEALLGLWPPIVARWRRPRSQPPRFVQPTETFCAAYLMEDMATLLAVAEPEGLRLRSSDLEVLVADRRQVQPKLTSVPEWVLESVGTRDEERIEQSRRLLACLDHLLEPHHTSQNLRLFPTLKGREWLSLDPRSRLKTLFEELRNGPQVCGVDGRGIPYSFVPLSVRIPGNDDLLDATREVEKAFLSIKATTYVTVKEFLVFHRQQANPLVRLHQKFPSLPFQAGRKFLRPVVEELEELWEQVLSRFLVSRLVPWGGARLGRDGSGELCFSLADAGRYLLGEVTDFEYGAEERGAVVVQPNFEVAFLSPAPVAEATLARYAVRKRRGLGVLLQFTRESIIDAAAGGLRVEPLLQLLGDVSAKPVPANVEREIRGWGELVRHCHVRKTTLVEVPDEEAMARLLAACGKRAERITDTLVELRQGHAHRFLLDRLRAAGIILRRDLRPFSGE